MVRWILDGIVDFLASDAFVKKDELLKKTITL